MFEINDTVMLDASKIPHPNWYKSYQNMPMRVRTNPVDAKVTVEFYRDGELMEKRYPVRYLKYAGKDTFRVGDQVRYIKDKILCTVHWVNPGRNPYVTIQANDNSLPNRCFHAIHLEHAKIERGDFQAALDKVAEYNSKEIDWPKEFPWIDNFTYIEDNAPPTLLTKQEDKPMKFDTKYFVDEQEMVDLGNFIHKIKDQQAKVEKLESALEIVGGKSTKITAQIEEHKANIKKLTELMESSDV